jgi:hypothetical protein
MHIRWSRREGRLIWEILEGNSLFRILFAFYHPFTTAPSDMHASMSRTFTASI